VAPSGTQILHAAGSLLTDMERIPELADLAKKIRDVVSAHLGTTPAAASDPPPADAPADPPPAA
jgi:hypothetical protein